jgi:hypothetical protein
MNKEDINEKTKLIPNEDINELVSNKKKEKEKEKKDSVFTFLKKYSTKQSC